MKTIDGRKAEITSTGKRFPNYGDFAAKHGYPDASTKTLQRDTRQKPQEGDIVTLLTSGPHLADYRGDTLWIVEAANGERHIFNEKGLRILSEESVTVLADESLGGVKREYAEVKRMAAVGERIKITVEETLGERRAGEIYTVTKVYEDNIVDTNGKWNDGSTFNLSYGEYVVLAPTDIAVIDGERLRLVERKANVGERIIITAKTRNDEHSVGDVFTVTHNDSDYVNFDGFPTGARDLTEYVVLESVDSAPPSVTQQIDGLTEAVAKLTLKVTENERRIAELEGKRPDIGEVARRLAELLMREVNV